MTFVKALRPKRLVFTVPQSGAVERQRFNFQMKLMSYTEEDGAILK
jgi:hypothetical protein